MPFGTAVKPDVPRPRSSSSSDSVPPSAGFAARVDGVSLAELVQMECLRGMRRVIRVSSEGRVGYLYFDQGQIVHATASGRMGENAALELLSWKNGTFDATEQPWPLRLTIHASWQSLILTAAQREDESFRDALPDSSEMVVSPGRELSSPDTGLWIDDEVFMQPANEIDVFGQETLEMSANHDAVGSPSEPSVLRAVRLDRDGNVLSHVGVVGEFADIAAYAVRLGSLIGEALGMDGFSGIECVTEEKSFLAFWEEDTIVALEAKAGEDIEQYKRRAGL